MGQTQGDRHRNGTKRLGERFYSLNQACRIETNQYVRAPHPPSLRVVCIFLFGLLAGFEAALPASHAADTNPGPPDWMTWRARRHASIAGTNGWASVTGLHWLREGLNPAGSSPTNAVVLQPQRAPLSIGTFIRDGSRVRFDAAPGIRALADGQPVKTFELVSDLKNQPTRLQIGDLTLILLDRNGRMGLRVKDPASPARLRFPGLQYYPYNPAWRLEGKFNPHPIPRTIPLADATGNSQPMPNPGVILFTVNNHPFQLDVVEEAGEDDFFVIFRDATAGNGTYGSGRFLYVPRPDPAGRVVIDFNRAYNPPCAFTRFATCPLPPQRNHLPFAIPAGERAPLTPHP